MVKIRAKNERNKRKSSTTTVNVRPKRPTGNANCAHKNIEMSIQSVKRAVRRNQLEANRCMEREKERGAG